MKTRFSPSLVTFEGEAVDTLEYAELLGIDDEDAELLGVCGPYLTGEEIAYLNAKYPEYMGIWPIIAKIGAGVAKVGVGIGKKIAGAVKKRREEKKEKKEGNKVQEMVRQLQQQQQAAVLLERVEQVRDAGLSIAQGFGRLRDAAELDRFDKGLILGNVRCAHFTSPYH